MSLEQKIDELVKVIERLVTVMESRPAPVVAPAPTVTVTPEPVAAPAPAPVVTVTPEPVQPKVVAETLIGSMVSTPSMPPLPTFTPAPALTGATVPFNDSKGLIDYVMGAYKAMGPAKGAGIQGVLTKLGFANINDVTPAHYQALYDGVEALK